MCRALIRRSPAEDNQDWRIDGWMDGWKWVSASVTQLRCALKLKLISPEPEAGHFSHNQSIQFFVVNKKPKREE